ncbi:MAG TPA: DUF2845 domain-containing protein [Cellvibrio sp.]|jgi:hypothetical protein|nr:DUF2845 domain-containing protein [Cellvibrio sp.]
MKICAYLALLLGGLYLQPALADSMRCSNSLIQTGDTKADVIDRCGEPVFTDSYCEPITIVGQANTTIIVPCEEVDLWTYHPGSGQFIQHLYFKRGKLQAIKNGRRL